MINYKYVCAAVILALLLTSTLSFGETIKASAIPAAKLATQDQHVSVPVTIDISELPEKLGSYTASLTWDAKVLKYVSYSPGSTEGFSSPVVNVTKTDQGKLLFAAAHPFGAEGKVNILNVVFQIIGSEGSKSNLNLQFTAMAAAYTFTNLLPYLENLQTGVEQSITVGAIPKEFALKQNYPNPFNPTTRIVYELPKAEQVYLSVYNMLGQNICTLVDDLKQPGHYEVVWDGVDKLHNTVPVGVYIYKLQAGDYTAMKKMVFIK